MVGTPADCQCGLLNDRRGSIPHVDVTSYSEGQGRQNPPRVDEGLTRRSATEYVLGFPSTTSSAARPARVTRTRSISRERVVIV